MVGGTVLSVCDGLTYTQLLDHGYGLTPITPSNSQESPSVTPGRTQASGEFALRTRAVFHLFLLLFLFLLLVVAVIHNVFMVVLLQSVKRRLVLEEGGVDGEGFRTPVKTPRRARQKSVSSTHYTPSPSKGKAPGRWLVVKFILIT